MLKNMKYTIFFSLLLLGVCSGKTLEQRYTPDDMEHMRGMSIMQSSGDSMREGNMEDMTNVGSNKNMLDMPERGQEKEMTGRDYDSQNRGNDFQKQSLDSQRENYGSQSRDYDTQRQNYYSHRQNFDSQKQIYNTQKNFNWQQRDHNTQRLDDSQKQDSDYQSRDDSNMDTMNKNTKDESQSLRSGYQRQQKVFSGFAEIKNYLEQQIRNLFYNTHGHGQNENVINFYSNDVPSFEDQQEIGTVVDKLALATITYKNVEFYGLSSAYQLHLAIDVQSHKVVVYMPLPYAQIKGQYTVSNLLRHAAGNFYISLSEDVSYVQTTSYQLENGKVHLGDSSGLIRYGKSNTTYENIGFFAQLLQGHLGKILLRTISTKVYEQVSPKLVSQIQHAIEDVTQNLQRAQIVSHLYEGINKTFQGVHEKLVNSGEANLELTSPYPHEYEYKHYKAKFASVTLLNIYNVALENNKITYTDTAVHAHIKLGLSNSTISALISYHSGKDAQNHEIHVQYTVGKIRAELELHKELNGGQLKLLGVQVHVSHVQKAPSQGHYEGELGGLVHHLASQLESYVSHSLENFIKADVSGILSQIGYGQQQALEMHRA